MLKLNKTKALTVCMIMSFCLPSCSKKDSNVGDTSTELEQLKAKQKALELELAKKKALEAEALEAESKALELELAKEKLLAEQERAEQERAEKERAEKEQKYQEDIAKRLNAQKIACDKFVNTKFDKLVLLDGKVLNAVSVTAANPSKVSLMHQNGVKNVKYSNLPEKFGVACLYDQELDLVYQEKMVVAEQAKMERAKKQAILVREAKEAKAAAKAEELAKKSSSRTKSNHNTRKSTETEVVNPVGHIKVKVVASSKGRKTVSVTAKSNVDGVLRLHDWVYHRYYNVPVKAGELYNKVWSNVGNRYEITLLTKDKSKVLDKETWNRKSGLRN